MGPLPTQTLAGIKLNNINKIKHIYCIGTSNKISVTLKNVSKRYYIENCKLLSLFVPTAVKQL
jgi:hypothetical protein